MKMIDKLPDLKKVKDMMEQYQKSKLTPMWSDEKKVYEMGFMDGYNFVMNWINNQQNEK